MWWWLLLLLLATANVNALSEYRGVPFTFSDNLTHTRRHLETNPTPYLVLHRTTSPCENPVAILEKAYFIIQAVHYIARPGDETAPWTIQHKMRANLTDEFPVVIRCATNCSVVDEGHDMERISWTRWKVLGGYNLTELVESDEILWIEPLPRLRMHTYDGLQVSYKPQPPTPYSNLGQGIIIAILDTGLDWLHSAFYDPDMPTPRLGNILPSTHRKVVAYITAIPGTTDYKCDDGCHGTYVSGQAAGFQVLSETGFSPGAKISFYDMSPIHTGETLYVPSSIYQYMLDVCDQGGATIISASWGSYDTTGVYDDLSALMDEVALARPYCTILVACGNSGPTGICSSPSNGKNVISVGASFSRPQAYQSWWADASIHPERYNWDVVASFSSTGPQPDGRISPLFYAPGVYEYLPYGLEQPTIDHAHYAAVPGTSFSAPALAGLVAELHRRFKLYYGGGQVQPNYLTRAQLIVLSEPMNGAVMVVSSQSGASPLSIHPPLMAYGFPKLPMDNTSIGGTPMTGVLTNSVSRMGYCGYATNVSESVVIGVAWADPSGPKLVNDIDVRVFADGWPIYPIYYDGANPHERVEFSVSNVAVQFRVVVYESDGVIQGTTMPFGTHWKNAQNVVSCGTCFGFESQACTTAGGLVGVQKCNVSSGDFLADCYPTNQTLCSNPSYVYIANNTCGCVPGTEVTCTGDAVKLCQSDGLTFSPCYSKYLSDATKDVPIASVVAGGSAHTQGPSNWVWTILLVSLVMVLA